MEQVVPEHHAPPVGQPRRVPLDDGDVVVPVTLLQQDGEVETGRSPADADDSHAAMLAPSGERRRALALDVAAPEPSGGRPPV